MNEKNFRKQLAKFDKQNEDNHLLDESELFIKLNNNHNLTESYIDNIDNKPSLKHSIQMQDMKDSVWRFDRINSMKVYIYKTTETNSSRYVEIPSKSSATLNIGNIDKFCFI